MNAFEKLDSPRFQSVVITDKAGVYPALRQFFAYLFARGFRFAGVCMPDSIDVDRDVDVAAAEQLIRNTGSAAPRS